MMMANRFLYLAFGLTVWVALAAGSPAISAPAKAPASAASPSASPAAAPTKTIVDYKKELGLQKDQIDRIKSTLAQFQTYMSAIAKDVGDKLAAIKSAAQEYQKMVETHADLETMKAKLRQIADMRRELIEIQYKSSVLDLTTSRDVEAILTPAQLKKWHALQAEAKAKSAATGAKKS